MKLSDRAYLRFKEQVFAGALKPGQIVTQKELIALTGIPLAPLRDALQKLAVEGMVQVIPQRGIKVADVSLKLVRDAYRLRMVIEREAVRGYTRTASDQQIVEQELAHREIVRRARDGVDGALLEDAQRVDWRLHDELVRGLDNDLVWNIHETNMDRIRLIRLDRGLATRDDLFRVMAEHIAVVEACKARDVEAAVRAIDHHLTTALRRAMGV